MAFHQYMTKAILQRSPVRVGQRRNVDGPQDSRDNAHVQLSEELQCTRRRRAISINLQSLRNL